MRISTVTTGVVVATMSICTLLNIGCAKENKEEIVEASKPKQAITETYIDDKDTETTYIDDRDVSNTYVDDRDVQNNYYDYSKEYSYDNSYNENKRIDELEAQIEELKKEQSKSEKTTIIKEEETVHIESSQPVQQTTNNNMEPNMVTCDHCGRQGELYENIMRWYDTDGNNNFTHAYCLENYLEATGKESAQKLVNLK